MTDFTIGVVVGSLPVLVLSAIAVYGLRQRDQRGNQKQIDALEAQIVELRQERTEDKELNRRLRRDLAGSAPQHLGAATAPVAPEPEAGIESEQALEPALAAAFDEVKRAQDALAEAQAQCRHLEAEVVDRDEKLVRYRESLREIREALEVRDTAASTAVPDGE